MISISELFLLLISCISNGSADSIKGLCISSKMIELPYVAVSEDKQLPKFDAAYWYQVPYFESNSAKLEVLFKGGKVLQSGVELVYDKGNLKAANIAFNEIYDLAYEHFGNGTKDEMDGFVNFTFKDKNTVFYILKGEANGYPILVFRVGKTKFWR